MAEKEYLSREDVIDAVWYVSKTGIVKEFSPADVVPVVHGHWVTEYEGLPFCSVCDYNGYGNILSPYCPNCGAKMDGKF